MQRILASLVATITVLMMTSSAGATTVRRATLAELVAGADVILYGVVRTVDAELATSPDGPFRTAIEVEVLAPIKGLAPEQPVVSLIIPGGRGFGRVMRIPGMPALSEGEEVVLLLEKTGLSYAFAGLGQGVFRIERAGGEPRVWRDLGDVHFVGNKPPDLGTEPTLGALLDTLRTLAHVAGGDR